MVASVARISTQRDNYRPVGRSLCCDHTSVYSCMAIMRFYPVMRKWRFLGRFSTGFINHLGFVLVCASDR